MKLDDVRPPDALEGHDDTVQADAAWFAARAGNFVDLPSCPACGTGGSRRLFARDGFQFRACPICRTIYVTPRPTQALLSEFLACSDRYRHFSEKIFPASEETRARQICAPRLQRILGLCWSHDIEPVHLVEIGPGYGTFAGVAAAHFQRVTVVEPTPVLADRCRARGLHVIAGMFEEAPISANSADGVVAFVVLAHGADPARFLAACHRALAPGGILALTCPNGQGIDALVLGARSTAFALGHLTLFNPASLLGLLAAHRFCNIQVETPGKLDVELVQKAADRNLYRQHPFLREVLFRARPQVQERFQAFLANNDLSSHMWATARKDA